MKKRLSPLFIVSSVTVIDQYLDFSHKSKVHAPDQYGFTLAQGPDKGSQNDIRDVESLEHIESLSCSPRSINSILYL